MVEMLVGIVEMRYGITSILKVGSSLHARKMPLSLYMDYAIPEITGTPYPPKKKKRF